MVGSCHAMPDHGLSSAVISGDLHSSQVERITVPGPSRPDTVRRIPEQSDALQCDESRAQFPA